jgi:hypothetical protein
MNFIGVAFATGLATVSVAEGARGASSESLVHFITADRNVECEMVDPRSTIGNVTCVLHSKGYTTRGDLDNHGLTAHYHPQWILQSSRPVEEGPSRREVHGPNPPRILRYGQTLKLGNFRCTSRPAGLTCASVHSKHGFLLSTTQQRIF